MAWSTEISPALSDNDETSIRARRFSDEGAGLGFEFQVNTYTTGAQNYPRVAGNDEGLVVTWQSTDSAADIGVSVQARRLSLTGSFAREKFTVNTHTFDTQARPDIAATEEGYLVVWESLSSPDDDVSAWSVVGRWLNSSGVFTALDF